MAHFLPHRWEDFLFGGPVQTTHTAPVPIWAAFLITQIGHLMSQHDRITADITALTNAYGQLVAANTAVNSLVAGLLKENADLKTKVSDGTATADDFDAVDRITAQIQNAVQSTVTAAAVPAPATPQAPVTDTPITPDMGTPAPVPDAPVEPTPTETAPIDSAPVDTTPNGDTGTGAPTPSTPDAPAPSDVPADPSDVPADPSVPVAVPASDSGVGE